MAPLPATQGCRSATESEPEKPGFIGVVVELTGDELVINDASSSGQRTIALQPQTAFVNGSRAQLRNGAVVFVQMEGGAARAVTDLSAGGVPAPKEELAAAVQEGLRNAKFTGVEHSRADSIAPTCLGIDTYPKTSDMLGFSGCVGIGSFNFGANLSPAPVIFAVPDALGGADLIDIKFSRFEFFVGAGGGRYEFPFQFTAVDTASEALDAWVNSCIQTYGTIAGCPGRPDQPPAGAPRITRVDVKAVQPTPAVSFIFGTGVQATVILTISTKVAGKVQTSSVSIPLSAFSTVDQSYQAAPLASGSVLTAEATACQVLGGSTVLSLLGVPWPLSSLVSPFDVRLCMPQELRAPATGFNSKISGVNSTVSDLGGASNPSLQFGGNSPYTKYVYLRPNDATHPPTVRFSDFAWYPILVDQFQFKLSSSVVTYFDGPKWTYSAGTVPLVSTPFPYPAPLPTAMDAFLNPGLAFVQVLEAIPLIQGSQPTFIDIPVKLGTLGSASVTSFAPTAVNTAGQVVTIRGQGFKSVASIPGSGVSQVRFDGSPVSYSVIADTVLQVTIPPHAPTFPSQKNLVISAWAVDLPPLPLVVAMRPMVAIVPQTGAASLSNAGTLVGPGTAVVPSSGDIIRLIKFNDFFDSQPYMFTTWNVDFGRIVSVKIDGKDVAYDKCITGSASTLCQGYFKNSGHWVALAPADRRPAPTNPNCSAANGGQFSAPFTAPGNSCDGFQVHVEVEEACDSTDASANALFFLCGKSVLSRKDILTYMYEPRLDSISPVKGVPAGGGTLTLSGAGFIGQPHVFWNGADLTAREPVEIYGPNGGICNWSATTSPFFAWLAGVGFPPPTCTPAANGNSITITIPPGTPGSNASVQVGFPYCHGGIDSGGISGPNAGSPFANWAKEPGTPQPLFFQYFAYGNSCGRSQILFYHYLGTPQISQASPHGAAAGGTVVTINGNGLTTATTAKFGNTQVAVSHVTQNGQVSDTTVTAIAPAAPNSLFNSIPATVQLTVDVDCNQAASQACGTSNAIDFTYDPPPNRRTSTITVTAATGAVGGTVNLQARLFDSANVDFMANRTVYLGVPGGTPVAVVTDGVGQAFAFNVSLGSLTNGVYPSGITASWNGDYQFLPATGTGQLTVSGPKSLTVQPLIAVRGRPATLSAVVVGTTGVLPGTTVTFTLNGAATGSAVTDSSGVAALNFTFPTAIAAGIYPAGVGAANADNALTGNAPLRVYNDQTIDFPFPNVAALDIPHRTVTATASSGLPVSFSSDTPDNCSVTADGDVTGLATGICRIRASQAGNALYAPAADVVVFFSWAQVFQSITFAQPSDMFLNQPVQPVATASSGLPVTLTSSTPSVCTVDGGFLHLLQRGVCTLTASQAGNFAFTAAASVTRSFRVHIYNSVVAWGNPLVGVTTVPTGAQHSVLDLSAAGNHSVALGDDNAIYDWGSTLNNYPNGFSDSDCSFSESTPLPAPGAPGSPVPVRISAGLNHGLAVYSDGTVKVWGQLENCGPVFPPALPSIFFPTDPVVDVAAGVTNVAITAAGRAWTWRTNAPDTSLVLVWDPPSQGAHKAVAAAATTRRPDDTFIDYNDMPYALLLDDGTVVFRTGSVREYDFVPFTQQSGQVVQYQAIAISSLGGSDGSFDPFSQISPASLIMLLSDGRVREFHESNSGNINRCLGANGLEQQFFDNSSCADNPNLYTAIGAGDFNGAAIHDGQIQTWGSTVLVCQFDNGYTCSAATDVPALAGASEVSLGRYHGVALADTLPAPMLSFVQGDAQGLTDILGVSAPVGSSVVLTASLRPAGGDPFSGLPGRTVSLYVAGTLQASAVTDGFGLVTFPAFNAGNAVVHKSLELRFAGDSSWSFAKAVADLNVVLKSQTITFAAIAGKTYGDASFAVSPTASSGLAVTLAVISGPATLSGNTVSISGAGSVRLRASQPGNATFAAAPSVDQTFTVAARPVAVAADAKSKTQGAADPALTYQVTSGSLINGAQFSGSLARAPGETPGTYEIGQGSLALTNDYALTFTGANLTIQQQQDQTITFAALADRSYGDVFQLGATASSGLTVTYTVTGPATLSGGNTLTVTGLGDVTVKGSQAGNAGYRAAPDVTRSFHVNPRPVTATADAKSRNYGDADPAFTFQITSGNLVFSDAFSGSLTRASGENIGQYNIQQGSLALSANYALTFVGAKLTIGTRAIAVAANAQAKNYGDADPAFTFQITSGSLAFSDAFSGGLSRVSGENIGQYDILQGSLALSGNYLLTFAGAKLTIGTRAVTVTADAQTRQYGDADPPLTWQITSGSLAFSDAFSGSLARAAGENIGSYAIQQGSLALGGNYALTFTGANLTIGTRAIAIAADAQSKTYGDADPALTYRITSGSLAFSDGFTGGLARAAGENIGSYAIQQGTLTLGSNYAIAFTGASLVIGQRPVGVTADSRSKTYGDADPALTYQITSGSLAFGDGFNGALTRAAGESFGSYAIQQGTLALSNNYALSFTGSSLTIGAKAITVAADGKSKTYGDADPALTYQITFGGLVSGDSFTGGLARAPGEDVGSYAIAQGTLALSNNYALTFQGAQLSIGQRPIAVAADGQSKTYGENDPALSYQITFGSLAFSDGFSGSLSRAAGEDVGSYGIGQGSLSLSSNYALSFTGASLGITARPITVTANGQSKIYGDPDPALTYSSDALAFADTFSGALTRVAGENAGSYAIQQGSLSLSSNYTLTYAGANLVIGKATPVLSWAGGLSGTYNQPATLIAALTFGPASAQAGTPITGESISFTLAAQSCSGATIASGEASCELTVTEPQGTWSATAAFAGDGNFNGASIVAPFNVALDPTTTTYTGTAQGEYLETITLAASVTETSSGQPAAEGTLVTFAIGGATACSGTVDPLGHAQCPATIVKPAGTYPIVATASGNDRYASSTGSASLVVRADQTRIVYTGPSLIANGAPITLSAVFTDTFTGQPVGGLPLVFTLGAQGCTGVTDASGLASCTIADVSQPLGPGSIAVSFADNGFYLAASTTGDVLVFAWPSGGAFVAGLPSANVGGAVTFWGSQWAKLNLATAPASFKGFASSAGTPACGAGFTTSPGNSSAPPATLPAYMAVIASSSVTQSGSAITGNSERVVIVRTGAGYAPNPGYAGTGTVVAVLCGGLPPGTTAAR